MFNTVSKAGVGLSSIGVALLIMFGRWVGLDIAETDAILFVQSLTAAFGLFMTYWGQWDRKDLTMGIFRK